MVLGGKQVLQILTPEHFTPTTGLNTLLNRKQSAASTAKDTAEPVATTQWQIPEKKVQETDRYYGDKTEN